MRFERLEDEFPAQTARWRLITSAHANRIICSQVPHLRIRGVFVTIIFSFSERMERTTYFSQAIFPEIAFTFEDYFSGLLF